MQFTTLALEIEFERALQFHDEGYESSDDYGLPKLLIRSAHIYSVSSSAETSYNPADYQESPTPTSQSTVKQRPVEFPLHQAVCRWLTVSDIPLLAADSDSNTEEDFPTVALNDPVWYKEPIPR